jgi:hypothetical protein
MAGQHLEVVKQQQEQLTFTGITDDVLLESQLPHGSIVHVLQHKTILFLRQSRCHCTKFSLKISCGFRRGREKGENRGREESTKEKTTFSISVVEPEPQGAGTFGWSRSRNVEVSAPA